ncbi:MAG: hypothetical protein LBT40_13090 [Deltaproteobacteria bacterium]|nr:hypothetical protein [Deltaproteobacteria bacterium]
MKREKAACLHKSRHDAPGHIQDKRRQAIKDRHLQNRKRQQGLQNGQTMLVQMPQLNRYRHPFLGKN